MGAPSLSSAARIALLAVVAVAAGWNLALTFLRVEPFWPLSPWESALVGEGWRWTHGLPAYGADRATHLYGPGLTWLLGGLEKTFGFNLPAIRATFVLFGFASCFWLARLVLPTAGRGAFVLAGLTLSAVNLQTGLSFPLSWPDMPALLCSVAAFALLARSRVGAASGMLAALLVVAAVFCKQTAALAALVLAVLWALDRSWRERAGFWLLLPLAAVALALGGLAWLAPEVFRQMLVVPASIRILPDRVLEGLVYVLRGNPLFWLGLGLALWRGREGALWPLWRPWLAVGGLLLAGSIWTFGKSGGYYNSLLPITLFLNAVAVRFLAEVWREDDDRTSLQRPALLAAFLVTSIAGSVESNRLLGFSQGDASRPEWVERVRRLEGKVVSPEDPALVLEARGESGLCLYFELDVAAVAGNWPDEPPPRVQRELDGARWLVTVRGSFPTLLTPAWLQSRGWRPVRPPEGPATVYTLWMRP